MHKTRKNLFGASVNQQGQQLGCTHCTRNRAPGIHKVLGLERIRQRRAMLWAMCPGKQENLKQLELVGPAGMLLWGALKPLGLTRNTFDVQNVVRCCPATNEPTEQELTCCSVYNAEALERNRGRAAVHVVLGDVAGRQLLGGALRKDAPVFWYAPWNAYVVFNQHPSFVLRQGGTGAGLYQEWCTRFRAVAAVLRHPGQYGYARAMDYGLVQTVAQMDDLERRLRAEAAAGRRISEDIETGRVNDRERMLMVGWGWGHYKDPADWQSWSGGARSIVLDHPQARMSAETRRELRRRAVRIMEDRTIRKSLHNGCFDVGKSVALLHAKLGADLRGYDYDTQLGTYLARAWLPMFSLESLAYKFLPEFGDYKNCTDAWEGNFADAPLGALMLRNCGDCDVTKRLEVLFADQVPYELLQVYLHAAFTLAAMRGRGPILDLAAHRKVAVVLPKRMERLKLKLQQLAGSPTFNPGSTQQAAWLLYDKLRLPQPEGTRSTNADYLEQLAAQSKHPAPRLILDYRELKTMKSNFLDSYARCAAAHDGELRTVWWLTGAVTGRLRSGASGSGEQNVVNLQNIHSNPLLRNMLVSDRNWRQALEQGGT